MRGGKMTRTRVCMCVLTFEFRIILLFGKGPEVLRFWQRIVLFSKIPNNNV